MLQPLNVTAFFFQLIEITACSAKGLVDCNITQYVMTVTYLLSDPDPDVKRMKD